MPPVSLLALAALLVCARAGMHISDATKMTLAHNGSRRTIRSGSWELPPGCMYEGRWFTDGAMVSTGEACLHCACFHGSLACRRRACVSLPDPPPHRCHVLHRRGSCCPELHCPDGVTVMEHSTAARSEALGISDIATPASVSHACVEGGTVYAAGSAMRSNTACEQCFCLGGARHCVRPRCLAPPQGCRARPASGACCPQRYYCEHLSTKPPKQKHTHDCEVDGNWVTEGERVVSAQSGANCTQCFCLRGEVKCQPLACAPPLLGCRPLLRPGECCAHQYHCHHKQEGLITSQTLTLKSVSALKYVKNNDRAFHSSTSNKHETATKNTLASISTLKNTPTGSASKNQLVTTTKVKRKTSDPPPENKSEKTSLNTTTTTVTEATQTSTTAATTTTIEDTSTTEVSTEMTSTEQAEETAKVMINGTINCTAELSSTSLPLNVTLNDADRMKLETQPPRNHTTETQPRLPLIDVSNLEGHTFSPNDIITDRNANGGFDEDEIFTINVTSSLGTNTSHTTTRSPIATVSKLTVPTALADALNISKKTKGDYDYDYNEPTLPPSLPNLKIIPFVAADAVVDNEPTKESLTYPMLEREDKFPVYYPSIETKDTAYATRREDVYRPTQYPIFITAKIDQEQYPSLTQDVDLTNTGYSHVHNDLETLHEFTVSTSLGGRISEVNKAVTNPPVTTTTFKIETPVVNLFSPPVETEGGFIPKGPELMDEYYAVYPSTPSASLVPHLTTSMLLDTEKGECVSGDGRRIPEGSSITLACSECTCAWSELHCSPRLCITPPGCRRRPATSNAADLCCGELICDEDNNSKSAVLSKKNQQVNETKITSNQTETSDSNIYNIKKSNVTKVTIDKTPEKASFNKTNTAALNNVTTKIKTTTAMSSNTTEKPLTTTTTTETAVFMNTEKIQTNNQSQEYEDDEEDEGFSFGSVLKLLLSDNYDNTTPASKKFTTVLKEEVQTISVTTTRRPSPKPSVVPFKPLPLHPFIPSVNAQNTVDRIDHLVLGEATAIKKTTPRPTITAFRPITTTVRPTTHKLLTKSPEITTKDEHTGQYTSVTRDSPRPPSISALTGVGAGLLKLAGCNIYGRMYRVGRIIAELSTPCQECWCTEFGVQCKPLNC